MSAVPTGLAHFKTLNPTLKGWAILESSLRDGRKSDESLRDGRKSDACLLDGPQNLMNPSGMAENPMHASWIIRCMPPGWRKIRCIPADGRKSDACLRDGPAIPGFLTHHHSRTALVGCCTSLTRVIQRPPAAAPDGSAAE